MMNLLEPSIMVPLLDAGVEAPVACQCGGTAGCGAGGDCDCGSLKGCGKGLQELL